MSKVILIIVGVIIAIMGILTLFPMMTLGLWLSIVLIGVGIVSIILGFLDKRKTVIKEEVKEIK
jgi:F0F1-type ATP synthase membrane subunit b/b'